MSHIKTEAFILFEEKQTFQLHVFIIFFARVDVERKQNCKETNVTERQEQTRMDIIMHITKWINYIIHVESEIRMC
jgi:hypothetical protein